MCMYEHVKFSEKKSNVAAGLKCNAVLISVSGELEKNHGLTPLIMNRSNFVLIYIITLRNLILSHLGKCLLLQKNRPYDSSYAKYRTDAVFLFYFLGYSKFICLYLSVLSSYSKVH